MNLYYWGKIPWHESQLIYHALAHLRYEGLALVSPASPYVCIGYHQDISREIDVSYCRSHDIPVFRRDLGGGAVYLDGNQLFFQLILHKDNPLAPKRKDNFYKKFIQPVIQVYHQIGIPAHFKPVNDILAGTRKICGSGAGEIGDCIVFVGNLIVDFNYEMMARILKTPDEKFRDKVHKSLTDNLTTIRRELGEPAAAEWSEERLNQLLINEFQKLLGEMQPGQRDIRLQCEMDALYLRMTSAEWLFGNRKPGENDRDVKIRSGVKIVHRIHKAPGGLIRVDMELTEDVFGEISISGDFFCFPKDAVERLALYLKGKPRRHAQTLLQRFYHESKIETPGITIDDWLQILSPGAPA